MEIFRALGALVEVPCAEHGVLADALGLGHLPAKSDHSDLFAFQLYPYASVYLGAEGKMGGEARDRIAGFWRALGDSPPKESDHLAVLLSAYAELCGRGVGNLDGQRARRAFLWEHLISWLPLYLQKLKAVCSAGYYLRWADLLSEALESEAQALGPLDRLPLSLRYSGRPADPREEGAEALLQSLLVPAKTGFILTRDDLRRLGSELGLAVRAGERRFVLQSLVGQDPPKALGWLASHAHGLSRLPDCWGSVAEVWEERRRRAANLLAELSQEAVDVSV